MLTLESWLEVVKSGGCTMHAPTYSWYLIRDRYRDRPFHNWEHIERGWSVIETPLVSELAKNLVCLKLAWAFHDAILDHQRNDNELEASKFAEEFLTKTLLLPREIGWTVKNYIQATDHRVPAVGWDQCLIADVDLTELALPWELFLKNLALIRREYKWLTDVEYLEDRLQLFEKLLSQPHIFQHTPMRDRYERAAWNNLQCSVELIRKRLN